MARLLTPTDYPKIRPLFQPLSNHLAIESALSGKSSARIYADSPDRIQAAVIWMRYRIFLAGAAEDQFVLDDLRGLFMENLIPEQLQAGRDIFLLCYTPENWEGHIGELLPGISVTRYWRQYYRYKESHSAWCSMLADKFSLRRVDADLLNEDGLKNLPELKEEMCSERDSVAEFLEKSFGVCVVLQDELVGWCLSEYNLDGSCEIGIGVQEAYRRRGLATLMTAAFVEEAQRRGMTHIGWDCWKENRPSAATALKAGFELVEEYPVYFCILNQGPS